MQDTVAIGCATYRIVRQFDPRTPPAQLIADRLARQELPPKKTFHTIDTAAAPQV